MTGNVVTNLNGTALQTTADPYASYGEKVGFVGTFLSFKNNEYLYGQDGKSLPLGTRVAANMAGLRIGWRRWQNAQVTDDLTELLVDQVPQAPRNTLGDLDENLWERDNVGKARDPWQLTNVLEVVDEDGECFIYSTSSKGGIGAIGRLCKEYGKLYRQKPGMVPIIELGSDFYMHSEYGKTYYPVFTIVAWADEKTLEVEAESEAEAEIPFDPPPPAAAAARPAAATKSGGRPRF